jgi:hypothetical protein
MAEITKEERVERALMIMKQLGGGRFKTMTGAKDITATETGVRFRIPYPKTNLIEIDVTPEDLYLMTVWRVRKKAGVPEKTLVKKLEYLYAEELQRAFTEATGLATHL